MLLDAVKQYTYEELKNLFKDTYGKTFENDLSGSRTEYDRSKKKNGRPKKQLVRW